MNHQIMKRTDKKRFREAASPLRTTAVLVCCLLISQSYASTITSISPELSTSLTYWEEEVPDACDHQSVPRSDSENKPSRRSLMMYGRMRQPQDMIQESLGRKLTTTPKTSPHPMRTSEWQLSLNVPARHRQYFNSTTLLLEFNDAGFVRDVNSTFVGTWKLHPSGITWQLFIKDDCRLQFHSDLILNPFGRHPKMVRGTVVLMDRPAHGQTRWFRPVVASFSGQGIGEDTADMSYNERRIGLSMETSLH